MKHLLFYVIILVMFSCNIGNQKKMNVYLANGDSIYYSEGKTLNPKNLHSNILSDSLFIQQMLSQVNPKNYVVSFKPMASFDNGGEPVAEAIDNFCNLLKAKGISYEMDKADSTEKNYFKSITILEYIENGHN